MAVAQRLSDALFPGARVFVPGHSGELTRLLAELAQRPEAARGVTFVGVQYPSIGSGDYLTVHPESRQVSFFMSPAMRSGLRQRRAEVLSLDYPAIFRYLASSPPFDVAYAQVSPPDGDGMCSAGLCNDFLPAVWAKARRRVAHVNPRMPRTASSFRIGLEEVDAWMEAEASLVTYGSGAPSAAEKRIGEHVAELVRDGDTLQFGIGSVPAAIAAGLRRHRRLKIHSGLASEAVRPLCEQGVLDPDTPIVTGVALGGENFYGFVATSGRFLFRDVGYTHDTAVIGSIERFIAINSAIQVDLLGQVNSESVNGAIYAGPGGLPAFAAGALSSPGGRSLICLAATAKQGAVSRIVPRLDESALCTLPRYLADVIVTEHGAAEVRGLSPEARARRLIEIAAAEHRPALASAWQRIRARLLALTK
jgi:acyl-CoA hydrolase